MKSQRTLDSQATLRKKNKTKGLTLFVFKTYYKATVIRIILNTERKIDINKIRSRSKPSYTKSAAVCQRQFWRETCFSTSGAETSGSSHIKQQALTLYLYHTENLA